MERSRHYGQARVIGALVLMVVSACSLLVDSDFEPAEPDPMGSTGGTGGSGTPGGTADEGVFGHCGFFACGGDIVGVWQVQSICVENPEQMLQVTGLPSECSNLFRDVDYRPAGELIFREDGTGEADITLEVDIHIILTDACIRTFGGSGVSDSFCSQMGSSLLNDAAFQGGFCQVSGNACLCVITSEEQSVASGGAYQVQGNRISEDSGAGIPFCVSGDTLQMKSPSADLVMVIALTRL